MNGVTCCTSGFTTTTGWDPVTGLGSINFDQLTKIFNYQNSNSPTSSPTQRQRLLLSIFINNKIILLFIYQQLK